MNPALTYTRGTSYAATHTYVAPVYLGATLLFTVKSVPNDTDITDTTNAIMTPKVITMSGSSFPQTTVIQINPADVSVDTEPGKYYYSIKVIDTAGKEYAAASGVFNLEAITTNEITS